ncbi:ATP-binding protein [Vallicoccus soli]|uniref:ATP-binding protein n=1 Tax=Vallicoccus soli TaxID=2339232 RepID=UPI001402BFCB|nr:ATP-binding protein [Vallicoccus soli]
MGPTTAPGAARARFPAASASVPAARRLVRGHLGAGTVPDDVVADAEVCVSELVTNAVLHARTELEVLVALASGAVRLEVLDRSARVPRQVVHSDGAVTGRGLEMVQALCRAWGVDPRPGVGKVVWCELDLAPAPVAEDLDVDALLAAWPDEPPEDPPAARLLVLRDYPVQLGLRAKEHAEALLRECALLADGAARGGTHAPERLLRVAAEASERFGDDLPGPDRERREAYLRGDAVVDLHYPWAPGGEELVREFRDALGALDAWSRDRELLTMVQPDDVRALQAWVHAELIAQCGGAAPTPWRGPLA